MIPVSVVIITKNEAEIIGRTIAKAKLITDDIVIIDNGSTDSTIQIAIDAGCRVYYKQWHGYAANKNKGIELAGYNWILSLDADEVPDNELIRNLHQLQLNDIRTVYDIRFRSYFGKKRIRFGKWGGDHHVRLFNRALVKWSESPVHETLELSSARHRSRIKGHIDHFSVIDTVDFQSKSINYARLSAKKYYRAGKRSSIIKLLISPVFNFVKNYILRLGFLDGKPGWEIARLTFKHTQLKYRLLQSMEYAAPRPVVFKNEAFLVDY